MSRYTVVYEGDPNGSRILNGEVPTGLVIGVGLGDRFVEEERLRQALIATGRNLGAGLSCGVSTDFLMNVPEEARLVVARLRGEVETAELRGYRAGYETAAKGCATEAQIALSSLRSELGRWGERLNSPWFYRDESFGDDMPDPKAPAPVFPPAKYDAAAYAIAPMLYCRPWSELTGPQRDHCAGVARLAIEAASQVKVEP